MFQKGRKKTGGMKKGTKLTKSIKIKEAFEIAFEDIGGAHNLGIWAQNNQTDFYKICSKFIPLDITSGGDKIGLYID